MNHFKFIKRYNCEDGLLEIQMDKMVSEIPDGYKPDGETIYTYTDTHVIVALTCHQITPPKEGDKEAMRQVFSTLIR